MLDEFVSAFLHDTCLARPALRIIALTVFLEETQCKAPHFATFSALFIALFIPLPGLNYHLFPLPLMIETPK
jgi:hypothetical protein